MADAVPTPALTRAEERARLLKRITSADGDERRLLMEVDMLTAEMAVRKQIADEHKRQADLRYEQLRETQAHLVEVMRELSGLIRDRAKRGGRPVVTSAPRK